MHTGNSLLAPAHPALGEGDTLMAAVETEIVVLMWRRAFMPGSSCPELRMKVSHCPLLEEPPGR